MTEPPPSAMTFIGPIDADHLKSYEIARNGDLHVDARMAAVSHLAKEQLKQLQADLLKQIPGNADGHTMDKVYILGMIGDADALEKLNQFLWYPGIPDQVFTRTIQAIETIQARTSR